MHPAPMLSPAPSLVVMTAAEDLWGPGPRSGGEAIREAVGRLAAHGVPIVLSSHDGAAGVLALQRTLGIAGPFICDAGAALYLPAGYFGALPGLGHRVDGWDVIPCASPRRDAGESPEAVRLVVSLFRMCAGEVIIVGVASQWRDRVLLREADVPIVIRRDGEQERLRVRFPTAYVTEQHGPAGWIEAMLGSGG